ncbi:MAG TPA: tRNA 2-thiouridine(34) synthase MnmA [Solirubrobacteraceae bacterium]|nr:tRNA 2-thiouridine(34) synthase MnmA [Solirubrobacteraceae bacterium]
MDALAFEHHLVSPQGAGHVPDGAVTATAGGGACCDEITFSVALDAGRVRDAGFEARGCGSAHAAGSAAVELVRGAPVLAAARIGAGEIAAELGGLSPGKLHAAELAADALARALGAAVRRGGADGRPAADPGPGATLVAMSGGVDSAVAAHLCARGGVDAGKVCPPEADKSSPRCGVAAGGGGAGKVCPPEADKGSPHDGERTPVIAVTLELWADHENDAERSCCSASAVAQARALAHSMGLAHFTLDLRDEFRAGVVEPFIAGYAAGETPNPCVGCNGHVRLDAMLAFADRLGCEWLATGHYARVSESDHPGGPLLRAAADPAKDQTYMLAALEPSSLRRMRFPLGELTKPRVREIAAAAGLPVAAKADSQDLCFLAGTDRARFLARHGGIGDEPGEIVDAAGRVLGTHAGQHRFTVGQRRGLGELSIHAREPLFVLHKDAASRRVTVGPRAALQTDRVRIRGARLRRDGARVDRVKLRYRSRPLPARVLGEPAAGPHRTLELALDEPADGAAPGQLACLMDGESVVGWGTIAR